MEKAHTTEKGYVGSMDTHFWTSPCRGRIFLTVCYSGLKHCLTQGMYNLRTPWGYERKYNSVWYHCFIRLSLVVFFLVVGGCTQPTHAIQMVFLSLIRQGIRPGVSRSHWMAPLAPTYIPIPFYVQGNTPIVPLSHSQIVYQIGLFFVGGMLWYPLLLWYPLD